MSRSATNPHEPLSELNDESLVARARQGSAAAFELIVRRHNQALFRAARGVLEDDAQAQDAVQDAYLKAFTHLDTYHARASLKTWLTRIVINLAIDLRRRRRPVVSLGDKVALLHSNQAEERGMTSYITDKRTPESTIDRQEMKRLLESALARLPEIYRSVFMLRLVEGMSVNDCAHCLDISEELVRKRLSRARELLRHDLLQRLDAQVTETFQFAGKRCDAVTAHVMAGLAARGMIKSS